MQRRCSWEQGWLYSSAAPGTPGRRPSKRRPSAARAPDTTRRRARRSLYQKSEANYESVLDRFARDRVCAVLRTATAEARGRADERGLARHFVATSVAPWRASRPDEDGLRRRRSRDADPARRAATGRARRALRESGVALESAQEHESRPGIAAPPRP